LFHLQISFLWIFAIYCSHHRPLAMAGDGHDNNTKIRNFGTAGLLRVNSEMPQKEASPQAVP